MYTVQELDLLTAAQFEGDGVKCSFVIAEEQRHSRLVPFSVHGRLACFD